MVLIRKNIYEAEKEWTQKEWENFNMSNREKSWRENFAWQLRHEKFSPDDIKHFADMMYNKYGSLDNDFYMSSELAAIDVIGHFNNVKNIDIFKKLTDMKPNLKEGFKNMPPKSKEDRQKMRLEKVVDTVVGKINLMANRIDLGDATDQIFSELDEHLGEEFVQDHLEELKYHVERTMMSQLRYKVRECIEITSGYK